MLSPQNGGSAAKLPECQTSKFLNLKVEIKTQHSSKTRFHNTSSPPHPPKKEMYPSKPSWLLKILLTNLLLVSGRSAGIWEICWYLEGLLVSGRSVGVWEVYWYLGGGGSAVIWESAFIYNLIFLSCSFRILFSYILNILTII